MIVVVTGMVGIDKKTYLQKVCELTRTNGCEVHLCNVGDMMYAEAPDITPGKILDIPVKRLNSLRRSAFKDIIAKAAQVPNLIVNTHATFRWRHGLFPAVDFDQMRTLNADMYICLMDGITNLHKRLCDEHAVEHTLKDLIVWREEEIICTEMLRNGIDETVPLYCLSRGAKEETVETFYRLIFEVSTKKAYLSYPMTHVVGMQNVGEEIDRFRRTMKHFFTCFDPSDIEEAYLPHYARQAADKQQTFIELNTLGQKIQLGTEEIKQIERDINSQTYARDFLLIDQSDMIISFIPMFADGRAVVSSGVERELQHAHEAAKEVYVIWNSEHPPSVFVTQTATKVFTNIQSAVEFFKKHGFTGKT